MNEALARNFADHINSAASLWTSAFCHRGADACLDAHEDYLSTLAHAAADWVQRRQEAGEDARRYIERLRHCDRVADIMRVQQDWYLAASQRMAADYSDFVRLSTIMMGRGVGADLLAESAEADTATPPRHVPDRSAAALRKESAADLLTSRANRASTHSAAKESSPH